MSNTVAVMTIRCHNYNSTAPDGVQTQKPAQNYWKRQWVLRHYAYHYRIDRVMVGLHRLPFITRCDRGCLMFTSIY